MNNSTPPCIGIFDSGLGGLSVLREIHRLLPSTSIFYIADQAHVPYGKKSLSTIRGFSVNISHFLINMGARLIVVACNTASTAALKTLRRKFKSIPFVGMEPAVKPAALNTKSGIVGVLATTATFETEMFHALVNRFANNIQVLTNTAPGLVEAIEAGELENASTRSIIEKGIEPMIARGADTIVLGCTHFPFVASIIQDVAGTGVNIIDPSPAVARRTAYLLDEHHIQSSCSPADTLQFATTGSAKTFNRMIKNLLSFDMDIIQLNWNKNHLAIVK